MDEAGRRRRRTRPIAGQQGTYFSLVAFGALELLIARGEWSLAAQLLGHVDQEHREYGWIPLDERNAAAPDYRRQVAEGLARSGDRPDLTLLPTAAMASRLVTALEAIIAGSDACHEQPTL